MLASSLVHLPHDFPKRHDEQVIRSAHITSLWCALASAAGSALATSQCMSGSLQWSLNKKHTNMCASENDSHATPLRRCWWSSHTQPRGRCRATLLHGGIQRGFSTAERDSSTAAPRDDALPIHALSTKVRNPIAAVLHVLHAMEMLVRCIGCSTLLRTLSLSEECAHVFERRPWLQLLNRADLEL